MDHIENGLPVVRYDVSADGIATIAMQRPKTKNAVNDYAYNALIEAFNKAEADSNVKCVVITGAPSDYFCSGADLGAGFDPSVGPLKSGRGSFYDPVGRFMTMIIRFSKPIIGAINGPAVGIGTTIVPHCDIVYAADTAIFWTPFTQLCVCPEFCSSLTFPKIFGTSVANEILFLGRKLNAQEALRYNFVSEVFPAGDDFLENVYKKLRPSLRMHNSGRSLKLFKGLVKDSASIAELERVHEVEMAMLDERSTGPDSEAAVAVGIMQAAQAAAKKKRDMEKKAKL